MPLTQRASLSLSLFCASCRPVHAEFIPHLSKEGDTFEKRPRRLCGFVGVKSVRTNSTVSRTYSVRMPLDTSLPTLVIVGAHHTGLSAIQAIDFGLGHVHKYQKCPLGHLKNDQNRFFATKFL